MAGPLSTTLEEKRKIAKGLYGIIPGGDTLNAAQVDRMSEAGVQALNANARFMIDSNTIPENSPSFFESVFGSDMPAEQPGAKDNLFALIEREIDGNPLTDPKEKKGLEAAIASLGGETDLNGTLEDNERRQLPNLRAQLAKGLSFEAIFNQNAENAQNLAAERERAAAAKLAEDQKLEAERALKIKAETATLDKYKSGLVFSGHLKLQDIDDPNKAAIAMNKFMVASVPPAKLQEEQEKIFGKDFKTWKPTSYAVEFIARHGQGMMPRDPDDSSKDRLESYLESNDQTKIRLAQGYMALQGENVQVTGEIDRETFASGQKLINQPLAVPPGLITADGKVNMAKMYSMAAAGQLYLPADKLSAADREAAEAFPLAKDRGDGTGISRESFIAARLIAANPKGYEAILAEENTRRAGAKLDTIDLASISKENVIAAVTTNAAKLDETALPKNLADIAVKYAAENGGAITLEHIPYVVGQADGNATTITGAIDAARLRGPQAGMSLDTLSQSIKLDPKSPDFQANMTDFLTKAYVLENARAGVTLQNVSPEIVAGFKEVAAAQSQISNSLVINTANDFGLPSTFLNRLDSLAQNNSVMALQVAQVLKTIAPDGAGQNINAANYSGEVIRTGLTDMYGKGDAAIDKIIEADNMIDVKDPKQLAVAAQLAIAMKDGQSLEQVRARPGIVAATGAAAEGYLGVNTGKPAIAPEQPQDQPSFEKKVDPSTQPLISELRSPFSRVSEAAQEAAAARQVVPDEAKPRATAQTLG